jgi:hypothetical protein
VDLPKVQMIGSQPVHRFVERSIDTFAKD